MLVSVLFWDTEPCTTWLVCSSTCKTEALTIHPTFSCLSFPEHNFQTVQVCITVYHRLLSFCVHLPQKSSLHLEMLMRITAAGTCTLNVKWTHTLQGWHDITSCWPFLHYNLTQQHMSVTPQPSPVLHPSHLGINLQYYQVYYPNKPKHHML